MFEPVLPWAILAVITGAMVLARLVALWRVLQAAGRRRGRAALRWGGVTLAVLLLIAAATRPALRGGNHRETTAAAGASLNVFLIVDRSTDVGGTRMTGTRTDIATVFTQYPAARYALVVFESKALLTWPLSDDIWSLRPIIATLRSAQNTSDVDAAAAGTVLRYQLLQAAQQYPGSRNVVLYFGSGAAGSRAAQGDFDLGRGSVAGGAVLGYGRNDAINDPELRRIAGQLGVPYQHRDVGRPFRPELPDTQRDPEDPERVELYWLPAVLAAALLLSEIFLSVREFRRGRIARRDLAT